MKTFKELLKEQIILYIKEHEFFELTDLLGIGGVITQVADWPTDENGDDLFLNTLFKDIEITSITEDDIELCFTDGKTNESYIVVIELDGENQHMICTSFEEGYVSGYDRDEFLKELFQTNDIDEIIEKY